MKEIKVFKDDLQNANYMVSRAGWYGDYADPTTFLDLNRKGDGNNDRKYDNPVYDGLLASAAKESDPAARMRMLEEAERIIMDDDLPMIPLYQYVTLYMFDPQKVAGLNCQPRTDQNLYLIDMLGDGKGRDEPRPMPVRPPAGPDAPGEN
jgi:oligopeptide transport system substrate-binding protein